MVKDRTVEFRSAIDAFSGGRTALAAVQQPVHPRQSPFVEHATDTSRAFSSVSQKLDQLLKLAKNKSLFDDKPQEFDSLAASVKRDLTATNRRIQELKGELSSQQTARSEQPPQRASKTTLEHQRTIVVILQGWNAQVLKSLEHILEVRAQTLKSKKDRRDQFGSGATSASIAGLGNVPRSQTPSSSANAPAHLQSATGGNSGSSSPKKASNEAAPSRPTHSPSLNSRQRVVDPAVLAVAPIRHVEQESDPAVAYGAAHRRTDDSHVAIDFSQQQQMQAMEQEPLLAAGYDAKTLRSRNTALVAIESTINELGTIYQQLAHMIVEQGEVVQRIDMNIEDMSLNVQRGQDQLARYLRRVSSNRWLIAKLFVGFIMFILLVRLLLF